MMRACAIAILLALAGCAAQAPKSEPDASGVIPTPPEPVHAVTYIRVPSDDKALTQCLKERRAEAAKTSKWREYADRLERLLGIDRSGHD